MRSGEKVRVLRRDKGLTQLELAVGAGITPNTITNLETGRVAAKVATLRAVAQVLEVTVDELLDD